MKFIAFETRVNFSETVFGSVFIVRYEYNNFEGSPNLSGAWNIRDSWSGQNAVISLEDGKLSHSNFDVKQNNLEKYRCNSCLVQTETNDIYLCQNQFVWTITTMHAVLNIKDNITADPHARYNYQLGKDIPPNQSIRLSFDLEHVEGDHDWQVGIVYSTTENAYQGNMIYFTATSGHNEINFVTPGYFWRVRLLHIPTAQDMEFNLDNFHIENLTQDSASKCHAAVISATDYSPFGAPLPGRTYQASQYRFGFNSKEKDDETYGTGNAYDFGARIYDARLGRWLSVDPLQAKYPDLGPYIFVGNSPIMFIDPDGKVIKPTNEEGKKAIIAMFESFSHEKYNKVFGLIGDHTLGYKTNLYDSQTGEPYGPAKFKKTALENGVSKEDVGAAYQVYLALESKKTLEVEVVKSSTAGTAKSGQDGSGVVDGIAGFTTNTKNREIPSLYQAIINGEGSGGDAVYLPNEIDRYNSTPSSVKGMVMINGTGLNEQQEGKILMGAIKQLHQNDETNKKGKK